MTERQIKAISRRVKYNEIRMFNVFLQTKTGFILSTLYITCDDYWVEEAILTVDQFLELQGDDG